MQACLSYGVPVLAYVASHELQQKCLLQLMVKKEKMNLYLEMFKCGVECLDKGEPPRSGAPGTGAGNGIWVQVPSRIIFSNLSNTPAGVFCYYQHMIYKCFYKWLQGAVEYNSLEKEMI